jgi:hypothetical protein
VNAGQTFGLTEISYSIAADAVLGTYTLDPIGDIDQTGSLESVFTRCDHHHTGTGRRPVMVLGAVAVLTALGVAHRCRRQMAV